MKQKIWYTIGTASELLKDDNGFDRSFDTREEAEQAYSELSKKEQKLYSVIENSTRA